ncbi:DUF3291 domain-containing protein [Sandaracinobacteroides saxicola]|uniref:DUF3291 domain-containing protein n=1 Tax=Sandaracinobacteroides saxicola TaxID=2759707 RepID=A0A7G5IJM0_9SPHN|nr:DUF3291 domain-containing protein [Sandaracinobacteroides saxicola]QMW23562.1 DUF3291 domain-containing protein [Sandaracinobacteroides saxicola]
MFHLAQINIARFRLSRDHPANADFIAALDPVNAQADAAPGFIWRLVGDGNDATDIEVLPNDPNLIVNMSVWTDLDALAAYAYRQPDHLAIMRRRRDWFEPGSTRVALWWLPAGTLPTVAEGMARIAHLDRHGPTAHAFGFRTPFPAPDGTPALPVLDDCA